MPGSLSQEIGNPVPPGQSSVNSECTLTYCCCKWRYSAINTRNILLRSLIRLKSREARLSWPSLLCQPWLWLSLSCQPGVSSGFIGPWPTCLGERDNDEVDYGHRSVFEWTVVIHNWKFVERTVLSQDVDHAREMEIGPPWKLSSLLQVFLKLSTFSQLSQADHTNHLMIFHKQCSWPFLNNYMASIIVTSWKFRFLEREWSPWIGPIGPCISANQVKKDENVNPLCGIKKNKSCGSIMTCLENFLKRRYADTSVKQRKSNIFWMRFFWHGSCILSGAPSQKANNTRDLFFRMCKIVGPFSPRPLPGPLIHTGSLCWSNWIVLLTQYDWYETLWKCKACFLIVVRAILNQGLFTVKEDELES